MTARYGMVVDLNRCVGCQTCTIACKQANDTPPGVQWRKVLDVEYGKFPSVERLFLVTGCQHCANPSCVPVCPTGATKQRADGLVTMDYDTCIGCGYCAVACPYQARTIVHETKGYYGEPTQQEVQTSHADRIGVANKCTFCIDRVDEAQVLQLIPGVDVEVTPACATSCITQAITFGDFADPASNVSNLARENKFFQMHADLGNDPQIKYLYEIPATLSGSPLSDEDANEESMSDLSNPLVGKPQEFWDYRAAMNFILGGMASGLALVAFLLFSFQVIDTNQLGVFNLAAGIIMACGLFFVFLKIGRKLRFLNVFLRPQSSWMTRETWCVAVFYPAIIAGLYFGNTYAYIIAGVAALGFLVSQARILFAAKGIPTWRAPLLPWMIFCSGIYEGLALLGLFSPLAGSQLQFHLSLLCGAGIILGLGNALYFALYCQKAKSYGIGPLSRRDINAMKFPVMGLGQILPTAFLILTLINPSIGLLPFFLACALTLLGGAYWKFIIITKACHEQGFEIPMMPQRGSGQRAAPERMGLNLSKLANKGVTR